MKPTARLINEIFKLGASRFITTNLYLIPRNKLLHISSFQGHISRELNPANSASRGEKLPPIRLSPLILFGNRESLYFIHCRSECDPFLSLEKANAVGILSSGIFLPDADLQLQLRSRVKFECWHAVNYPPQLISLTPWNRERAAHSVLALFSAAIGANSIRLLRGPLRGNYFPFEGLLPTRFQSGDFCVLAADWKSKRMGLASKLKMGGK